MTRPGRKFAVDIHLAKQIKQMSKHFFVLNEQTMDKFVFVMAASSNHFEESMDGVASIQHHFPGKKLFYYDLGLHHQQVLRMKSWKWVEYRKFDFTIYPKYFDENLRMVGWKPIIIQVSSLIENHWH
ncbi:hypothetical protein LSH36_874g01076 [Paralvinella palmiformis]|uniref:Uncharacterized protein n=1 Tax=Paralvinella palmiformis TaxID=53620 RepID=A0AAD9MRJ9_9ANNE|nr:hypothetical protein LSH36_874g01076 [Paralvinella palmiformis]